MTAETLEQKSWAQLRLCFDYEIPVNIVDLGLIYGLKLADLPDGKGKEAFVEMTFTNPMCPMADVIQKDIKRRLETIPEIKKVVVQIVWDPPWDQSKMSEAAKLQLGLL